MKIVIIEDEKAAVRNLTSLLNEIKPNGEIVTILDSISSTIEWFSSHPMPELVFMDIHLADGSAFEIFNHINITCPIIFTTAYDEYALRAFKVNSIDYLLKPIGKEDIEHAFDKLQSLQDAADKHQFPFPQQENELLKLIHSLQKQETKKLEEQSRKMQQEIKDLDEKMIKSNDAYEACHRSFLQHSVLRTTAR